MVEDVGRDGRTGVAENGFDRSRMGSEKIGGGQLRFPGFEEMEFFGELSSEKSETIGRTKN